MEVNQDLNKPVDDNSVDFKEKEAQFLQEQRPANPEPLPEPQPCCCEKPADKAPEKKKNCCNCTTIFCILMALAVILLYIFHFAGIGGAKSKYNPNATAPVVSQEGGLKVAYIDTDTLMAKYQYALDLQKELEQYQASKENSLKNEMNKLQSDYQNYLQTGDKLTLAQQKSKEEELQQRGQKLQSLEGEYAMQVQEKLLKESEKMTKAVYAFIREYNAANQQFDIILSKSFNSSPVLYGNPGMDITQEILDGLNEEYASVKGKKADDENTESKKEK